MSSSSPYRRAAALVSHVSPHPVHGSSSAELMDVVAARARSAKQADYSPFKGSAKRLTDGSKPLRGLTLFVSGASRGIGLAIALRAARDGANVCVAAKTATPDPRLPGTIHTAAAEVEKAGGRALAVVCDIRSEESVAAAIAACVSKFGGLDILVNNASAISLTGTADTSMKKYDLMTQINSRGTYLCTKLALPHLRKSRHGHVLNLGPPLTMLQNSEWWAPHAAYSFAKFGMSVWTMSHAAEFKEDNIAVNSIWPLTTIATAAVGNLLGGSDMINRSRKADIMADAAYLILTQPGPKQGGPSGQCYIDEHVLRNAGVKDFSSYAIVPGTSDDALAPDFFV